MVMKKRKKSNINWKSCPVCGGNWKRQSGFLMCEKCGHKQGFDVGFSPYSEPSKKKPGADEQIRVPKMIRRGRLSYKKEIE
jgi:hypothetical protein